MNQRHEMWVSVIRQYNAVILIGIQALELKSHIKINICELLPMESFTGPLISKELLTLKSYCLLP